MKLTKALRYLQQPGCLLVGTNMDNRLPLENGHFIAGTGCLVRAVEMAAQRQADIIGKPSRFIFDCVSQEYGINPERTVMVGDRLDTDILLGVTCGLKTILTLTGVSTLADVKNNQESDCMSKKEMVPDFYVDSIADLLPALQDAQGCCSSHTVAQFCKLSLANPRCLEYAFKPRRPGLRMVFAEQPRGHGCLR
ncbi:glycerol-3-phosphate phosphatase [Carlito syrichta]|uniref:Glycerol-3-phosphate phosphatase n=1 Tax=Carlito syrichta TaxID=1868482 RepID=A0A1U7T6M3_CARSF|nr:glycerol-3-phosphate phosphatase [Carlito syrichta]